MTGNKSRGAVMAAVAPLRGDDCPARPRQAVYVAEYDGQPPRVMLTEAGAKAACVALLECEKGMPAWGWVPDAFGWEMRALDPETDAPRYPLGGRVTKTLVEQ